MSNHQTRERSIIAPSLFPILCKNISEKYNIRVNSIAPGLLKSEITQGLMQKEWLKNVTERTIPLKVQQTVDPGLTSLKQMLKQLEPWCELKDKVVLLTGASSGIGREVCLDLGKAGCKIIAAARRVDRLESLCSEINSLSSTGIQLAAPLELDVSSDAATIQKAVKQAWDIFGKIDVLINNAGIRGNVKTSLDLTEDEWNTVFRTNLSGPWLVSKYVCSLMRDAKRGGSVINVSSIAGLHRGLLPGGVAYACSKGGVDTMTRMMAIELGVYNIRVNSIAPGLLKSEITQGLMQKEWLKNVTERSIPLKVQQTVDPGLTSLVRYLIHDSSRYVSGNTYILDSGATIPGLPIFSSL
ncbi:hypothetical protein IGI04_014506 [Brassica rapa subsp. trilocularis]|uniref:3-oxoacyl-[acyl-carrier-protein] reductase n=2 Tax=Brassica campestris TaxID=3711 RepID=A0ABQ7MQU7_BRACM|nr:hypothetical protein IGI04_014506 [Brassica rapa subsp. trilocularis]